MRDRWKHRPRNSHWDSLRHPDFGCWLPIQGLRIGRSSCNRPSDICNLPAVSGYVWLSSALTVSHFKTTAKNFVLTSGIFPSIITTGRAVCRGQLPHLAASKSKIRIERWLSEECTANERDETGSQGLEIPLRERRDHSFPMSHFVQMFFGPPLFGLRGVWAASGFFRLRLWRLFSLPFSELI